MKAASRLLRDWLNDIEGEAAGIVNFTTGRAFDDLMHDEPGRCLIGKKLGNIGEAERYISLLHQSFHARMTDFPWQGMRAMRNHLTHGYFAIDWLIVWSTVHDAIPVLLRQVRTVLLQEIEA